MPDDNEVEIKFKTTADLGGAEKAADSVKEVTKSAETAGTPLAETAKAAGEVAQSTTKMAEASKQAAPAVAEVGTASRGLMSVLGELAQGALIAGIGLLITGVLKLREHILDLSDHLGSSKWDGFTKAIEAQKDAWDKAEEAAAKYWRAIDRLASKQNTLHDETNFKIEDMKAEAKAVDDLEERKKRAAVRDVHDRVARGELTSQEGRELIHGIEATADQSKRARADAVKDTEFEMRANERANAEALAAKQRETVMGRMNQAKIAQGRAGKVDEEVKNLEKNITEAEKEQKVLEDDATPTWYEKAGESFIGKFFGFQPNPLRDFTKQNLENQKEHVGNLRRKLSQLQQQRQGTRIKADEAVEELHEAEGDYKGTRQFMHDYDTKQRPRFDAEWQRRQRYNAPASQSMDTGQAEGAAQGIGNGIERLSAMLIKVNEKAELAIQKAEKRLS